MLGFWQTIEIALRLPYAKFHAAVMVLGPIAAFVVPKLIPDDRASMFAMMVIVFTSSVCIERFCTYVKAVRMEDIKRNSENNAGKAQNKKNGKKKKR